MDHLSLLTKHVEIDFMREISNLLKSGRITVPQAKQAGKDFLVLLPFQSEDDMKNKIKAFCIANPKLEKIHELVIEYVDEDKKTELLGKLRTYIHEL